MNGHTAQIPRPDPASPVWVVRSVCGRDRKRIFLAFRCTDFGKTDEAAAVKSHSTLPLLYLVNGALHPVECPKKKHLSHVKVVGTLNETERTCLFSDYSNKTAALLAQKYDKDGELFKKRENSENLY